MPDKLSNLVQPSQSGDMHTHHRNKKWHCHCTEDGRLSVSLDLNGPKLQKTKTYSWMFDISKREFILVLHVFSDTIVSRRTILNWILFPGLNNYYMFVFSNKKEQGWNLNFLWHFSLRTLCKCLQDCRNHKRCWERLRDWEQRTTAAWKNLGFDGIGKGRKGLEDRRDWNKTKIVVE